MDVLAAPPATELVFYGSEVPAAGPWLRALQRVEQHALHFAHFIFISCSAACVLYKRCQLFRGSPHGQSQLSCFVAILMLETMRSCLAFCLSAGMGGAALPDRLLCQSCGRWPACCTSGCGRTTAPVPALFLNRMLRESQGLPLAEQADVALEAAPRPGARFAEDNAGAPPGAAECCLKVTARIGAASAEGRRDAQVMRVVASPLRDAVSGGAPTDDAGAPLFGAAAAASWGGLRVAREARRPAWCMDKGLRLASDPSYVCLDVTYVPAQPWLLPAEMDLRRAASAGVRCESGTGRYGRVLCTLSEEKMRVGTPAVEEVQDVLGQGEGMLGPLHSDSVFTAGPAPRAPGQPAAPAAAQALQDRPPAQPASCRAA